MTYEERCEVIAEEKNEHRQVEKHFEDLNRKRLEEQLSDALTRIEEVKADCDFALEGKDVEIKELKAQIPQWHDLRKDTNDLPKEDGFYLVKLDDDSLCNYETDSFYLDDNFVLYGKYVIAWCEIPTFKE